ncbi:MAG: hypothetical protein ACR2MD_18285 [Aridibacter sp.]|jgi:hypothetical protein|nr:hypothetical protein [Acidobacteriota bacterium]
MKEIIIKDWILECDVDATKNAYQEIKIGSAEGCGCIYCNNFTALRDELFQGEILELLEKLGIDYKKDAETYEATLDKNKHLYGLWFHSIGRIIKEGNPIKFENGLIVYFLEQTSLRYDIFADKKLIQVEIENAVLPWVLDKLPNE